ncbi:MAG: protein kinase [Elusimicrobia bacterium]|nr:protein kinase [Elusimicrobiota bacterium]
MSAVRLEVTRGPQAGKVFEFPAHDTFIFGRSGECHCAIPDDPYISANHFLLEANPPDCELRDLGSKNGTRVNGELCGGRTKGEDHRQAAKRARPVRLKDGDLITAGQTEFKVSLPRPDPGPATKTLARPAASAPGEALPQVPGWRVEKEVAKGGMGTVYLAFREGDGERTALKVVRPEAARMNKHLIDLFLREMKVSLGLRHPNIVRFLDEGFSDGVFYFAMEFCESGSAAELMEKNGGRLELSLAGRIAAQALEGLGYAHSRSIVHRDLKPHNILLHGEGPALQAKLADFGIAKDFSLAGMSGMTASGSGGGTLYFMPKEQLRDFRKTRPVSDVFSLGACLYNMLTNEPVYDFESVADPCLAVLQDKVVPIGRRGVRLPEPVAAVIDKSVAPDMSRRFQTAAEFRQALQSVLP